MKEKDKYRYAEKCLYEYKQNVACLEVLKKLLKQEQASLDVHAQNYESVPQTISTPSNPVQARVLKIEQIEGCIKKLERWVKPITLLIKDLNSVEVLEGSNNEILMKVLKLVYFGQNQHDVVIGELNMSRRMFYYYKQRLVNSVICYLAL